MEEYVIDIDGGADVDPHTFTVGSITFNDDINLLPLPMLTNYNGYTVGELVSYSDSPLKIDTFAILSAPYRNSLESYKAGTIVAVTNGNGFMLWNHMKKLR